MDYGIILGGSDKQPKPNVWVKFTFMSLSSLLPWRQFYGAENVGYY